MTSRSCFKPHNRATERRNFACIAVASHTKQAPREVRTLYVGGYTPLDRSLSLRAAPRGCSAERTARLHGAPPHKCALTSPTAQSGRGPAASTPSTRRRPLCPPTPEMERRQAVIVRVAEKKEDFCRESLARGRGQWWHEQGKLGRS